MKSSSPYNEYATYYDVLQKSAPIYKEYVQFLISFLRKKKIHNVRILDVACGTGLLTQMLKQKGFSIEGVEGSLEMAKIAQRKGLTVHHANMVDFNLGKTFDVILCTYDSLNFLQNLNDINQFFKRVVKHLSSGGNFIFDMNTPHKLKRLAKLFPVSYQTVDDAELIGSNQFKNNALIMEKIIFKKIGKHYVRFSNTLVEKLYDLHSIKKLLQQNKFRIEFVKANFEFEPIRANSKRWIFICKKM